MKVIDNDYELNLQLTVGEVNAILHALQEIPAKICNPLTNKIHSQSAPQLDTNEDNKKLGEKV